MKIKIISIIAISACALIFCVSCGNSANTTKNASSDSSTAVSAPPVQATVPADTSPAVSQPAVKTSPDAEPPKNVPLWKELSPNVLAQHDSLKMIFKSYKLFALDSLKMQKLLAKAPLEKDRNTEALTTIVEIPRPDGGFMKFRIYRTTVMEPALEARYPLLRTYGGQGIEDPSANVRLDFNQNGFHAYVISQAGEWFIEPKKRGVTHQMLFCYFKSDVIVKRRKPFELPDSLRR